MRAASRRSFLKTATLSAAALATRGGLSAFAQPLRNSTVRQWSTVGKQQHALVPAPTWQPVSSASVRTILLKPTETKQEILGFGGALTDATCWVLDQLPEAKRTEVLRELFAPTEMALNVCRTCIGSSDYSRSVYSFDESAEPDPELKKFSIDHDKAYILPVLRAARQVNPELFLFGSPWSPPGWMKSGGSMLGGAMRKSSFAPYAQYFRKFLDAYAAEGVRMNAVSVQNEVDVDQDGRMPACLWGQEYEIEFVKQHLGPTLRKAGLDTKIWVLDHNYNLWGRAEGELSDAAAAEYIDGVAWHGYVGTPDAMTRVHEAFPQKNAYWTEGGPDVTAPDYLTDHAKWTETFNTIANNWARSITTWNLALDEKGNPNLGPFPCGGLLTIENGSHAVARSGQYWALAHFSRHVRRGAKVLAAGNETNATVTHAAFRNPDGGFVVVLANRGERARVQLALGNRALELDLPADSAHTLEWN